MKFASDKASTVPTIIRHYFGMERHIFTVVFKMQVGYKFGPIKKDVTKDLA